MLARRISREGRIEEVYEAPKVAACQRTSYLRGRALRDSERYWIFAGAREADQEMLQEMVGYGQ